jgi:hypothetical protein
MLAADMLRAVARLLRDAEQVDAGRRRSAAALLRRLAACSELEQAAAAADALDIENTLRRAGLPLPPASVISGQPAAPDPERYAALRRALEEALVQRCGAPGGDWPALRTLSRRQLGRQLACLPVPRSEGGYEPLLPPPGK